jgi:signal transduction histidine kinase
VQLALLNIGLNARGAMPNGGLLEIAARKLTHYSGAVAVTGRAVAVHLRDTGTGIPKEVLGRVFEPFFTTKPRGQGTGLGFSQAYGFAEQAGGTVRIRSEPGQGTEVTFLLSAAVQDAAEQNDPLRMPSRKPGEP